MEKTYTIQPGDSLSLISQKFYGDYSMVDAIVKRNLITNKDLVFPGTKLILPDVEDAEVITDQPQKQSNSAGLWILAGMVVLGVGGYFFWIKRKDKK